MSSNGSKKKANIVYFVTKNDTSFMKFPNLIVTRERILNFESFYVNKDYCREFISAHGEASIIMVGSCFKFEIFQYFNGWVNNSWEGKTRCVHSIILKRIISKRNLTVTKLLNLPDVREGFANANALKACFLDFLIWLKNTPWMTISLFWSSLTKHQLIYIIEEHSHLIPVWYPWVP